MPPQIKLVHLNVPALNKLVTLACGTQFIVTEYRGNSYCLGFYAAPGETCFSFGHFQLEAQVVNRPVSWRAIPRGWMYSFTEVLKALFKGPTREIFLEHRDNAHRTEAWRLGFPTTVREFSLDLHEVHFEHVHFGVNSKDIFKLTTGNGAVETKFERIIANSNRGELTELKTLNGGLVFFTGSYDNTRGLYHGEQCFSDQEGYSYYSGTFLNAKKHGEGVEFKVDTNSTGTTLSWLEGTWHEGRYHGEFIQRKVEAVIKQTYEYNRPVGITRVLFTDGKQSLSQQIIYEEKLYKVRLDFDPQLGMNAYVTNESFYLPDFLQLLKITNENLFLQHCFELMTVPIAKVVFDELVKRKNFWAPAQYFGQATGALEGVESRYHLVTKIWNKAKVNHFISQVLNDLVNYPRNPLMEGLRAIEAFDDDMNVSEMETFSAHFPMFPFTKPKLPKDLTGAIQTLKEKVWTSFAWMLTRLELTYTFFLLHQEPGAALANPILVELKTLAQHIDSYRQNRDLEEQALLLWREHETGCLEIEEEAYLLMLDETRSFSKAILAQKEAERPIRQEKKRQQEEAKRLEDEMRREEIKRQKALTRQQEIDTAKKTLIIREEADRFVLSQQQLEETEMLHRDEAFFSESHQFNKQMLLFTEHQKDHVDTALESEERQHRTVLTQSFFAQKALIPTWRRPLITDLLSSLPRGIETKAIEYGIVLEASQLLLIYQGMVLSALQKLKHVLVEKETDLILEAQMMEFNKRPFELRAACFKNWLIKEAKFYAEALIVLRFQNKTLSLSDLKNSNTERWLTPECLLKQMQRVAHITPTESLEIIFFMMIRLCQDKKLPISIKDLSSAKVATELDAVKAILARKEGISAQMKAHWWSSMVESAEMYLTVLFSDQLVETDQLQVKSAIGSM